MNSYQFDLENIQKRNNAFQQYKIFETLSTFLFYLLVSMFLQPLIGFWLNLVVLMILSAGIVTFVIPKFRENNKKYVEDKYPLSYDNSDNLDNKVE